jgi:proton-dependent oligopeptide transporter, POT family
VKALIEAFKALRHAPRALWIVILAYTFDATAYYGIILLMKAFLGQDLHIAPALASTWVSLFTGAISIVMLFVGKTTESRLGLRKSIALALALAFVGRLAYVGSAFVGGAALLAPSLALVALAEGIIQPSSYAGVKRYTNAETSSMGFALLYAGLNFGAMIIGPISAHVRTTFDRALAAGTTAFSGYNAVNVVCAMITAATLVGFLLFMRSSDEAKGARGEDPVEGHAKNEPPYKDARFMFFVFALLPVRTLFAHQWLTMPEYVLRSYPPAVADRMEWFVQSMNPLVILFGVPILTALTKRFHVLSMMIVGSLVSAASTFLLASGPSTLMLVGYFVIFSIGEALWSSRFYEYASELAPPGRVTQYMGIASLPWFVAKTTTGLYSGWVLEHFVPAHGAQNSGTMWLLYGAIAMLSPSSLFLARRWVRSGM